MTTEALNSRIPVASVLSGGIRWMYHSMALVAVVFLVFYATIVCPFIDSLPISQVFITLGSIGVFHVFMRELLLITVFPKFITRRIGKSYHMYSLLTWGVAGISASALHIVLYPDFPIESHLKLLIGYWALGGGFVATIEAHTFSQRIRKLTRIPMLPVSFSTQFLRLVAMFIFIPNLVLVLIVFRFAYEGYIVRGAGYELIFLMMLFGFFAMFIALAYGRELARDTFGIVHALRQVAKGDFRINVDTSRPDELGYVSLQVNRMAKDLQRKQRVEKAFGRFVNPIIAERFLEDAEKTGSVLKQGRNQFVTIMMCDIRRFTTITENMPPRQVTEMLNSYFQCMITIVHRHGGIIDKFIGDAFLAIFGILEETDRRRRPDVEATYKCGYEMLEELSRLNQTFAKEGMPRLEIGIGVHYGEVIAGYIGASERLEFTVIGANVNMASRIESAAKAPNPPLLLSEQAAGHLMHVKDTPQKCLTISLRGFSQPVALYTHPALLASVSDPIDLEQKADVNVTQ